jgi:murein DD-endopeptidase MepM/ murein hydrolase activator NlpD
MTIAGLCLAVLVAMGSGTAQGRNGGISTPAPPQVSDITCVEGCAGLRAASEGSKVALSGASLAAVSEVSFARRDGGGRVSVAPESARVSEVVAKVPEGAGTGVVRVSDAYGQSADSPELEIVRADETESSGPFRLEQAQVSAPRVYYSGKRKAQVQFMFKGDSAQDVRIDVVNRTTGERVRSMVVAGVAPGAPATTKWNGQMAGGDVAPSGDYKFRLSPMSGGEGEDGDGATNFSFYGFKFPVVGKHYYGDGVGADRGDHTHQGQDVLADCGLPLVAVRAGTVQAAGYNGGAGNYLVIDAKSDDRDYVYMHLQEPAIVRKGERVKTGERVGRVGTTGSSTACHLHFEMWSAPGWYEGGEPMFEVTKALKKWDTWS